jgi:hypothetical protein
LLPQGDGAAQKAASARFVWEASAAARLHHPHSVTVLDHGVQGGTAFMVMELLQGRTLAQLLRGGRLPVERAVAMATQTASAVSAAHRQGIVHRDLKPANLFLVAPGGPAERTGGQDFVKVLDYGLAKPAFGEPLGLTVTGRFLGSPGYMAPEQIRGEATCPRCDIYALGAIVFEMVAGVPPFARANLYETMVAHVHEPLPALTDVLAGMRPAHPWDGALEAIVQRAMAKDPADRYATMAQLHDALARLSRPGTEAESSDRLVLHAVAQPMEPTWTEVRLNRALFAAAPPRAAPRWHGPPPKAAVRRLVPPLPKSRRRAPRSQRWLGALALALGVLALGGHALWPRAAIARGAVMARLDSVPQGAEVWLGDAMLCRQTPCTVPLRRSLGRRHVSLRFVHPHYEEFVATRRLTGAELRVEARLEGGAEHRHEHLHQNEADDGHLDAHGLL